MFIWYLFFLIIAFLFVILIGIYLSKNILSKIEFLLFWLLYIISVLSIISLVLTTIFFIHLKDKKGPVGKRGPQGEKGDKGKTGICEPGCRNSICTKNVLKEITSHLNKIADNPNPPIEIRNIYIKEKIKQICKSDDYEYGSGMKGPKALNEYIQNIWKTWVELIYKEGGRMYFESIGGENEWEWSESNPYNEIKKYDLFYWGLGPHYKPQIKNRCIRNTDIEKQTNNKSQNGYPDIEKDNMYKGSGWEFNDKKSTKYSVLSYLYLLPQGFVKHKKSGKRMQVITANENKANSYTIRKINPSTSKYDVCLSVEGNIIVEKYCNLSDSKQFWEIEFTGNKKECRIKKNGQYLKQMPLTKNSSSLIDKLVSEIPSESDNDYTLFDFEN